MPSVAVIIPTTGAAQLRPCIASVLAQQGEHRIKLVIVIDGPEFAEAFARTTADMDLADAQICQLPANVGRNGFYGHRVYAAFSHLIDTDFVCFLDQDNWLDPGHVASLVDAIARQEWDWAFALRKVVSAAGDALIDDESQSVGPWSQAQPMKLVDTNCYCLRADVAQRVASHWHGGWGQDRVFFAALSQTFPNFGSTGRYTVHYRTRDDMQSAVTGLLARENALMRDRHPDGLPWVGRPTSAPRPGVPALPATQQRSFDIFDTLIARRCIRPVAVFEEVERRCGATGFPALRQAAERAVDANEYTLADIYRELARLASLDAAVAQALMAHEIAIELEMVVPMADNLALLRDDSLLITDMYLPVDVIRQLLAKAGVPAQLSLLRTSHGKRRGEVWRALASAGLHCHHLGDHAISDLAQPQAVGMQATLSTLHLPTPTEHVLIAAGCPRLAETLRALRLATPRGLLSAEQHRLQVELNLPVLLISALHLLAQGGSGPFLFSSRDARYLHMVYDAAAAALPGRHPPSAYWFTSRVARAGGAADYLDYCRDLADAGARLVDLCGTGASVAALRAQLGLAADALPLFVCERIESPAQTQALTARYGLAEAPPLPASLWTNLNLVPNEVLELLNYVPEGMVRGVKRMPGGVVPQRAPLEFSATTLPQVQEQARFVQAWAQALRGLPVTGLLDEMRSNTLAACAALGHVVAGLLPPMQSLMNAWLPEHRAQEQTLMAAATLAPH